MICPKCGTDNKPKFKFCVKCGSNLKDPAEVNIEQVDMGGYRSETDEKNQFKISSGTFTIKDRAPAVNNGMFTADELNDTEDDFDFSSIDEPFIPKLDADRIKIPSNTQQPRAAQAPQMSAPVGTTQPQMNGMGVNPYAQPVMTQPLMNGMAMNPYGQPVMSQPQIVGYDQNGMPVYSQPMMMQPQIIGYDQNGMPVYGQPMIYAQPVIIGYDQNGMPIYGQAQPMMYAQQPVTPENGGQFNLMPNMGGMPVQGAANMPMYGSQMQQAPLQQPHVQPEQKPVNVPNKFWNEFFSESDDESGGSEDDFFGSSGAKSARGAGGASTGASDINRLKKAERRKREYMSDTPEVNAADLKPNDSDKINKLFMRGADKVTVNGSDLGEKKQSFKRPVMHETDEANADDLVMNEQKKTRITMIKAGEANAEDLEVCEHEHKEAIMAQAEHAVEALPKKKEIVDEVDAIELPAYMQARKTVKEAVSPAIPDLPSVK